MIHTKPRVIRDIWPNDFRLLERRPVIDRILNLVPLVGAWLPPFPLLGCRPVVRSRFQGVAMQGEVIPDCRIVFNLDSATSEDQIVVALLDVPGAKMGSL